MHRQYLHIENRTIAYYDSAPGDRVSRVALLVHAFPLSGSMWEPQLKAIPTGWRVIAPDLRGFGGSTITDSGDRVPSIDDYADDIIDLLRELKIASPVLGGLSMGGYVTFAVLRKASNLAHAVVLADTRASADSLEGRGHRRSMLALLDREGASGIARDMIPKLLGKTTMEQQPDMPMTVRRLIKQQSVAAIRGAILRMMDRPDSFATVTALTVPMLVIVGEEDSLTPVADSRKIHAAAPRAELVVIPHAGHLANIEQPAAFNDALSSFLSRL